MTVPARVSRVHTQQESPSNPAAAADAIEGFRGSRTAESRARRETPVHQALAGPAEGTSVSRERRHPHPGRARLVALPRRNYVGDRDTGRSLRWKLHFQCDLQ